MNKKDWKERLINFFDTKGFYIIVVVCLFIIGFSIYTIATTDFTKYEIEEKQDNNVSLNNSDTSNAIPQVGAQEVTKQDKLKNNPVTSEKSGNENVPQKESEDNTQSIYGSNSVYSSKKKENTLTTKNDTANNKNERQHPQKKSNTTAKKNQGGNSLVGDEVEVMNPLVFKPIYPVSGKIIREFSDQSLVYSKTLDEWTEHSGIDIQAEEGSDVKACFDGTVIDLGEDPLYGKYVVIDHSDGYISKYFNLTDLKYVQVGDIVRQGQKIGEVGTSSNIEYMDPPHLHFEILYNGENQNPVKFLPQPQ
ncbi:M23 family metallopeptidase [Caldicellulosiruptor sp. DIB 104C]|uniref:M23 family metallopeptidase n=1 Tax=Caldicellulosiruptor sp. DIB 104C TaxID=3019889 RepID=UPI002306B30C|nr:M23 family metallopeptidase [Caldicellulosiruptor sp. DIB 104C]